MGPQRFFLEEKLSLNNPSDLRFQHGTVFLYPKFENKKKRKSNAYNLVPTAPMKSVGIQSVKTNNNSDSDSQTCRRSLKSHSSLHDSF